MSNAISNLRKRWLALAAVVVLIAVVFATGSLFAANEQRQQAEIPAVAQQPQAVADVAALEPAAVLPAAPPAPERAPAQQEDNDYADTDLPPPATKTPPASGLSHMKIEVPVMMLSKPWRRGGHHERVGRCIC